MNIAIVGSSGYIATYIINHLQNENNIDNILKIDQSNNADEKLNLENPEGFNYASLNQIDTIIFTAAISSPDECASQYEKCWKINVEGTVIFIGNVLTMGKKVLFFSSDAVFGDDNRIFTESSETNAVTPYGKMKKYVEDKFKLNKNFKAIRLSYVTSKNDRFISYCCKCIKDKQIAEIFHPFYRNCITVTDVINVVKWLINNWDKYTSFVLNVTGRELVSRIRIADEINRICNNKLKYTVINPGNEFYKNRPSITQMTSNYLWSMNIIEDKTFTEKIKKELEEINL